MSIESNNLLKEKYDSYVNGEISLSDFLSDFNIEVDESRIDDITIVYFNADEKKIELLDKKSNVSIKSEYLKYSDDKKRIIITSPMYQLERLLNGTNLIREKLTFYNEDYSLEFFRERPYRDGLFLINEEFSISYTKKNGNMLFKRRYGDKIDEIVVDGIVVTGFYDSIDIPYTDGVLMDKYTYYNIDNVFHAIINMSYNYTVLRGFCLEKRDINISKKWDSNSEKINVNDYPQLKDSNVSSAMIFSGFAGEEHDWHSLEVYKIGSNACVKYRVSNEKTGKNINQDYNVQLLNDGNITSDEVRILSQNLLINYEKDDFIGLATSELSNFGRAIDIRKNGYRFDITDILNPVLYKNMLLEEIALIVEQDKEKFFEYCSNYVSNNRPKPVVLEKVDNNQ